MIEQSIERLAAAVELLASKLGAAVPAAPAVQAIEVVPPTEPKKAKKEKPVEAAPAPVADKPAPAPTTDKPAPLVTIEDLRLLGQKCIAAGKREEMKAIVAKTGAEKLSAIDPANYSEVAKAFNALLPANA